MGHIWDVVVVAQYDVLFMNQREFNKLTHKQLSSILDSGEIISTHMIMGKDWRESSIWQSLSYNDDAKWCVVRMYFGSDLNWWMREDMQ